MCESAEMIGPAVTMRRISSEADEREWPGTTPRLPGQPREHRRGGKPAASGRRLRRLVFGADPHAVAAGSADIVAHRGGEIERRDPVGGAGFDDPAGVARPAELIAELGLVAIEGDQLVTTKGLELLRGR